MPLFWLSLAFLMGILLGEATDWSLAAWVVLAAVSLLILILWRVLARFLPGIADLAPDFSGVTSRIPSHITPPYPYFLLVVFVTLGAARYQSVQPQITPEFIAWYNDQDVNYVIEGLLVAPLDERDEYTNLRVQVERLHPVGELLFTPVEGALLAKVPSGGDLRYGDRVRLQGRLRRPAEGEEFSYREYLARQGIYSSFSCGFCLNCSPSVAQDCVRFVSRNQGNPFLARVYEFKTRALQVIYQIFPDPEASLLAGILLGVETGIPQDVQEAFKDTGTSHIIAISGFNFAIIAGLFIYLFGRLLGRWRGMAAAFIAIGMYAVLIGPQAVVIRAAIMGGLAVFAAQMGRRQNGVATLVFVAAVMASFNPNVLWDVGFQLSFMATLGLLLYAEPLSQAFQRSAAPFLGAAPAQRMAGPVGEFFLFTLAAQLTTLPVILYHFQRLSIISLLANPLILPVQPPVMVLGGLATMSGVVYQPLGQAVAYLAWPFVVYTIRVVEFLAKGQSTALSVGHVSLVWVLGFYGMLFAWTLSGAWRKKWMKAHNLRLPPKAAALALAGAGLLAVVAWQMALSTPDGRLYLTMLDVGSGDGFLVQSPTGRYLLIDGGPSPSQLSDSLGRRLPFARRTLDYLVVSAAGEEQLAALPRTIERFPPQKVLWAGPSTGSWSALQLRERLAEERIPLLQAQAGQTLDLGDGAALRVLAVGLKGAVLALEWGDFYALLPVGMDFDSMERLLSGNEPGGVSALLLAEGGYAPLNPPEWIARWRPQIVLLSVAASDEDGRPDPDTLDAIQGYTLLRTDLNGWVQLSTDGKRIWVEAEKP